jgi:glycosyltransferase involved in cell wall biosynthesis
MTAPFEPLLTIAIPTYNRPNEIRKLINDIAMSGGGQDVSYSIVDDGSDVPIEPGDLPDKESNLTIRRNAINSGYARTFARLLEESESEFVLLTADDDVIDFEILPIFLSWLTDTKADFISTQWRRADGRLYRGQEASRQISPAETFSASRHAPGLCYRTSAVKELLPFLHAAIAADSDASIVYPQVLLASQLIAQGRGCWWAGGVINEGAFLQSGIRDSTGSWYGAPESRVRQFAWFDAHFAEMIQSAGSSRERTALREIKRINLGKIYPACRMTVAAITGATSLDRSAARFALGGPARKVWDKVRWVVRRKSI